MVEIRKSTSSDVQYLKDKLRQNDVAEIWASNNHNPEQTLTSGLDQSHICMTALVDGKPIAMFGTVDTKIDNKTAVIWMVGTDDILKYPREAVRVGKEFLSLALKNHTLLYNYVKADNEKAIKFLRILGAEIGDAQVYGIEKELFMFFAIRGDSKCVAHH